MMAQCMHTEPNTPCDWDVCRQPERLADDDGEPHSAAYQRLKAAGAKAMDEAKLHALHGMKRVFQLARRYGDQAIPAAEVLAALGLDRDANTVESLVKHRPARGDEFEAWLKAQRELYLDDSTGWNIVDDLLDTYRLHADTGTPLDDHVCEARMVGDCTCTESGEAPK